MSGDVQPRKRKDKKKKKDDLRLEEPRGTAAVLGEGDVFIHSHHDHGTGGHWCAKIIFFSLLAVLVTLVGLIILENRGLTELEANAVESRYSGVLEGWLEDAPEDDHHDEHTLELKHHDDDDDHTDENDHDEDDDNDDGHDDDHTDENDHDEDDDNDDGHDDDHTDENDHDEDDDNDDGRDDDNSDIDNDDADHNENDEDQQDDEDSQEQDIDTAEDEDGGVKHIFSKYFGHVGDDDDQTDNDDDNDDDQHQPDEDSDEADENNTEEDADHNDEQDDDNLSKDFTDDDEADDKSLEDTNYNEPNDWEYNRERDDEDEDEQEEQEDELDVEVERIEREDSNEEPVSTELPALPETDDDSADVENIPKDDPLEELDDETDEFLENDDEEPSVLEHVSAPAGQPFTEVEDVSSERPSDTLADEEEYEKRQEELRREREQASHMWLKLVVGGALLVATHAVVRRATAPRDVPTDEEHIHREETPTLSDRRMTLILEEPSTPVLPKRSQVWSPATIEEEVIDNISFVTKSAASSQQESDEEGQEEEEEEPIIEKALQPTVQSKATDDKELYSDEDEAEDDEVVEVKKEIPKSMPAVKNESTREPEHEDEVPDDVEIIEDEELEEELEEEEEDISDVDDAELLTRLEAKYGRLPEPERPGQKHKDGGNSIEDEWPGEPSDAYWRQELDRAEQELRQGEWTRAAERAQAAGLDGSGRARWIAAVATDRAAEAHRDNRLLTRAIAAYLRLLEMNERLSDSRMMQIANRTLDRIQFRGNYLAAEPVYRLLIRRFPDDIAFRNNLSVTFLMANRADLAGEVLKETLKRWPNDRIALAHYGFVLKTHYNRLAEAVDYFQRALEDDKGPATEPRFYYHLGDSLLLLGRHTEAHEVHKRAAAHGHFLSAAQRSLYNVPRLRSRPWWNIEDTPYVKLARTLEKSWRKILKEGEAAQALYEQEKEGLKERGEWSQLDLFVRGKEIPRRCAAAPVTCAAVRSESAAAGCRRGQVKFSAMAAGTHVRPHVGPTNCRLRMHLGLTNTEHTYIRVDRETRQWQVGKTFLFDDSFEHEVWHNGTGTRLVLIVDVWHPDLAPAERRTLPAI